MAETAEWDGRTLDENADRASGTEKWLMPAEAAALFPASTRALRKWAKAGLLHANRTPGGHRRYREAEVRALVAELAEGVAA
jgi:hypothetical protein